MHERHLLEAQSLGAGRQTMVDAFRRAPGNGRANFGLLAPARIRPEFHRGSWPLGPAASARAEIGRNRIIVGQPSLHCNINARKKREPANSVRRFALSRIAAFRARLDAAQEDRELPT